MVKLLVIISYYNWIFFTLNSYFPNFISSPSWIGIGILPAAIHIFDFLIFDSKQFNKTCVGLINPTSKIEFYDGPSDWT